MLGLPLRLSRDKVRRLRWGALADGTGFLEGSGGEQGIPPRVWLPSGSSLGDRLGRTSVCESAVYLRTFWTSMWLANGHRAFWSSEGTSLTFENQQHHYQPIQWNKYDKKHEHESLWSGTRLIFSLVFEEEARLPTTSTL